MGRLKKTLVFAALAALVVYGCASQEEKKQSHFEKGKAYFEKGEYKSARIEFKMPSRSIPSLPRLIFNWLKPI